MGTRSEWMVHNGRLNGRKEGRKKLFEKQNQNNSRIKTITAKERSTQRLWKSEQRERESGRAEVVLQRQSRQVKISIWL